MFCDIIFNTGKTPRRARGKLCCHILCLKLFKDYLEKSVKNPDMRVPFPENVPEPKPFPRLVSASPT